MRRLGATALLNGNLRLSKNHLLVGTQGGVNFIFECADELGNVRYSEGAGDNQWRKLRIHHSVLLERGQHIVYGSMDSMSFRTADVEKAETSSSRATTPTSAQRSSFGSEGWFEETQPALQFSTLVHRMRKARTQTKAFVSAYQLKFWDKRRTIYYDYLRSRQDQPAWFHDDLLIVLQKLVTGEIRPLIKSKSHYSHISSLYEAMDLDGGDALGGQVALMAGESGAGTVTFKI